MQTGRLYVVAAPSGAGKTSLVKALMEREPRLRFSVSYTTRKPRPNEVDGEDYHFVTQARFREMVDRNEFLEHAQVFDNFYGTGLEEVQRALRDGELLLLEIDWQGALQIRALFPAAHLIFILPPSWDELAQRLRSRGEDLPEVIARRLENARHEVAQAPAFDFVIINGSLDRALAELLAIVKEQPAALAYSAQRATHPAVFAGLGLA